MTSSAGYSILTARMFHGSLMQILVFSLLLEGKHHWSRAASINHNSNPFVQRHYSRDTVFHRLRVLQEP